MSIAPMSLGCPLVILAKAWAVSTVPVSPRWVTRVSLLRTPLSPAWPPCPVPESARSVSGPESHLVLSGHLVSCGEERLSSQGCDRPGLQLCPAPWRGQLHVSMSEPRLQGGLFLRPPTQVPRFSSSGVPASSAFQMAPACVPLWLVTLSPHCTGAGVTLPPCPHSWSAEASGWDLALW